MKKVKYIGILGAVVIGGRYNRKVRRGEIVTLPEGLADELLRRKVKGLPQWEDVTEKQTVKTDKTRKGVE